MENNIAEELLASSSEEPEAPVELNPEVETPEVEAAQTEVETPDEPEKVEKEPETPVEPTSTDSATSVPMSAHIGLRKDLEGQINALKSQLGTKPETTAPPSVFEDEAGAFAAMEAKFSDIVTNQLLNTGQSLAARDHGQETVDAAISWVTEAVQTSPFLLQQFTQTPLALQADKAVELYKAEQTRAELEDPVSAKEKLRAEVKLELLEEQKAELEKTEKLKQSIPKTLTGDSSKGGLTGSDWTGPVPLESVIGPGG